MIASRLRASGCIACASRHVTYTAWSKLVGDGTWAWADDATASRPRTPMVVAPLMPASSLVVVDGRAAEIADGAADKARAHDRPEAAAGDESDARADRTAGRRTLLCIRPRTITRRKQAHRCEHHDRGCLGHPPLLSVAAKPDRNPIHWRQKRLMGQAVGRPGSKSKRAA